MTFVGTAVVAGFLLALICLVTYALLYIEMPRRMVLGYVALDLVCVGFLIWFTVLGLTA